MSFKHTTHEIHQRRLGRNVGLALVLVGLIALVFGLTAVKITGGAFEPPRAQQVE